MKGFKQTAMPSKKEALKNIQTELKNIQMAVRINQMMTQQIIQQFQRTDKDVQNVVNILNDLQYRTLAMIELAGTSTDALDAVADKLKLKDYNEASDKEDAEKKYVVGDVVKADSIVVITSEAAGNKGIFRSKFKLSEANAPELQGALEGKKVGDHVKLTLNGLEHDIELVGVREETVPEVTVADVEVASEEASPEAPLVSAN